MRVLFCSDGFTGARDALIAAIPDHEVVTCHQDDVLAHLDGVDVLIPAMARIGADIMDRGSFRLIHQFATGVESIDLHAAKERGIPVTNIPAKDTGNADAVAELAILHLLSILRDLKGADQVARSGGLGVPVGRSLVDRRVVVFGLGAIGKEVARRLAGFKVHVTAVGRRPAAEMAEELAELGVQEYATMEDRVEALRGADAVIVAVRVTPTSVGIIGRGEITAVAPGAILVNVARGAAVEREALIDALRSGHLSGAGLDVYWQEPADPADEIFTLPVSVTPHVAGVTDRSYRMMAGVVAENIRRLEAGEPLLNLVEPDAAR